MRVGIYTEIFIEWGGGIDFIRILLNGLQTIQQERRLELVVFIPEKKISKVDAFKIQLKQAINKFYGREKYSVKTPKPLDIKGSVQTFQQICEVEVVVFDYDKQALENVFKEHKIEVVLPCFFSMGKSFSIPWVGYLYDFQHAYYPSFFQEKEIRLRNHLFEEMVSDAKVILVNAASVKNDVNRFYPQAKAEVVQLPFCPLYAKNAIEKIDLSAIFPEVPEKFFLVSNQFWQHKNHKTAFVGLAKFYEQYGYHHVHLVCTGEMHDYRNPGYLQELKDVLKENNIQHQVHLLGYIGKKEQQNLMQQAIGLVQPTLFEGGPGGGSAYEAIAMGKNVLLSDIPVNKEIQKSNCLFFEALNPSSFAKGLHDLMFLPELDKSQLPSIELQEKLALGKAIGSAIDIALKGRNND